LGNAAMVKISKKAAGNNNGEKAIGNKNGKTPLSFGECSRNRNTFLDMVNGTPQFVCAYSGECGKKANAFLSKKVLCADTGEFSMNSKNILNPGLL